MEPTPIPDDSPQPTGAGPPSPATGGFPTPPPAPPAVAPTRAARPRPVAGVSRRAVTIGAAALAAAGGLTGWFAATATDDDPSGTTVENQVSTVDPSADIPSDDGPVFGNTGGQIPSDQGSFPSGGPDTSSGAS